MNINYPMPKQLRHRVRKGPQYMYVPEYKAAGLVMDMYGNIVKNDISGDKCANSIKSLYDKFMDNKGWR